MMYALFKFARKKFCPPLQSTNIDDVKRESDMVMARASRWIVKFKIAVSFLQVSITGGF
jgi:hypothetical protein